MVTRHKLSTKDETPTIEKKQYKTMIRGLQYLNHTRPNIESEVGIVDRFQDDPKEYHYVAVKRIFRYLKGTSNYEIWYDRSSDFTLCTYTNVDWVGSMDDRKRIKGGAFFLGGRLVSWLRKKKYCISQSSTEAEYVATPNNCNQVMWMKKLLKDIRIEIKEPIIIYYNNTSTMSMSKNHVFHSKTMHISIKYHVLREKAIEKEIRLGYVSTKDQISYIFTKPLPKDTFE